jgi:hypothetical protein
MIRTPHSRRLPLLTLTVLVAGTAALLAPAAVPASPGMTSESAAAVGLREAAAPGLSAASVLPAQPALPLASEVTGDGLTAALTALAATKPSPNRDEVRKAFADAGFPADSVEVSLDQTPTGLAVDSIRGAAMNGDTCLFGEVREGQVSVTALPKLDSGYCFVGDQR